ncbi:hypothetical protein [Halomonas sp. E19]|uniref:hypothetical protein n=1 Tax=Halomonas sp. E19 TaxID=3397247 RepID=UPI004033FB28
MLRSKMIHLSVGRKVAVIVALPLLILLLVMVNESLNRFQVGQEARQLEMMANMAELSGQVLAETQRERAERRCSSPRAAPPMHRSSSSSAAVRTRRWR